MKDANHPIWPIVRLAVLMSALCFILWLNASHFDHTELKTLVEIFLVAAGAEGVIRIFGRGKRD